MEQNLGLRHDGLEPVFDASVDVTHAALRRVIKRRGTDRPPAASGLRWRRGG